MRANEISTKLFEDWTDHLRSVLDDQKIDTTFLLTDDRQKIAVAYLTWEKKKISRQSRQVLKSKNFICPEHLQKQFDDIEKKFMLGESLDGHLSVNVEKTNKHDYLLYDWGVHHLHFDDRLSSGLEKKQRSRELLFVFVTSNVVYILAVMDHSSFTAEELIEILDENWPEVTDPLCIKGACGLSYPVTSSDRSKLRRAAINAPIVLKNGKCIMSMMLGGGLACSGESSEAVDKMFDVMRYFDLLGEYFDVSLQMDEHPLKALFNQTSDFRLGTAFNHKGEPSDYAVIDLNTGQGATLTSLLNAAREWEHTIFCERSRIHAPT